MSIEYESDIRDQKRQKSKRLRLDIESMMRELRIKKHDVEELEIKISNAILIRANIYEN